MKYRGYYIDHVVFNSKKDIDEFIKQNLIKRLKKFAKWFVEADIVKKMAIIDEMMNIARALHEEGLSYAEIEEIENEAMA